MLTTRGNYQMRTKEIPSAKVKGISFHPPHPQNKTKNMLKNYRRAWSAHLHSFLLQSLRIPVSRRIIPPSLVLHRFDANLEEKPRDSSTWKEKLRTFIIVVVRSCSITKTTNNGSLLTSRFLERPLSLAGESSVSFLPLSFSFKHEQITSITFIHSNVEVIWIE